MSENKHKPSVLPSRFSGGPFGLGDPNDLSLRKVEKEIMIPKKMRDKANLEKCFKEVEDFSKCCKNKNILMVFSCRKENSTLKECLTRWYLDEDFKAKCTKEYLEERSEYRRTGISKQKSERLPTSM